MKVLQFKTQNEYDEWIENHELFECYDNDLNLIGSILGPDADNLVAFGIASINPVHKLCNITKELTESQIEALKENTLVKVVILDEIFQMTLEQRVIIKRLRKNFEDAKKVGLQIMCSDGDNIMYFVNGNAFDVITSNDNLSGEWKTVDGERQFVKYTDDELSNYVQIDTDLYCQEIKGDRQIDFVSWDTCLLPWYAHLKD